MDTFTFLIAMFLIAIAFQFEQNWLIFGIVAIMIISLRSLSATFILLVTVVAIFFIKSSDFAEFWPAALIGLIILNILLGVGKQPKMPEMYSPYGGLMGGLQ